MHALDTRGISEEMNHRVIEALAAAADTDPLSMTPTLYEVIDPDALDRLLDTDESVTLQFEYDGHTVVAKSDGTVSVDGEVFDAGTRTPSAELH